MPVGTTVLSQGTPHNAESVKIPEDEKIRIGAYYRYTYYVTPSLAAMVPLSIWQEFVSIIYGLTDKIQVTYVELLDDGTLLVEGRALEAPSPVMLISPLGILAVGAVAGIIATVIGYFALQRVERFFDHPLGGGNGGNGAPSMFDALLAALSGAGVMLVVIAGLALYFFVMPKKG